MNIEITRPEVPLNEGRDEVWIKVQGHEVTDFRDVQDNLPEPWKHLLGRLKGPSRYIPLRPLPDELDKGQFFDWWIVWADRHLTQEMERLGL